MKDTLTNKFGSFRASLDVANKDENVPIWQNLPPLRFTQALSEAGKSVEALASKGAVQSENITGSTQALRGLRKQFEQQTLAWARATFRCLKSLNRIEDAAKVDFTPSDLRNARAVALAGMGEVALDLGEDLSIAGAPGEPFGLMPAKYTAMNTLWQNYSVAVGAPATARSKRFALTKELPHDFAATETLFAELDDLILQFRGTPAGEVFVDTWFQARHVIDLGHHHIEPPAPPSNPTTTTTTTPSP